MVGVAIHSQVPGSALRMFQIIFVMSAGLCRPGGEDQWRLMPGPLPGPGVSGVTRHLSSKENDSALKSCRGRESYTATHSQSRLFSNETKQIKTKTLVMVTILRKNKATQCEVHVRVTAASPGLAVPALCSKVVAAAGS